MLQTETKSKNIKIAIASQRAKSRNLFDCFEGSGESDDNCDPNDPNNAFISTLSLIRTFQNFFLNWQNHVNLKNSL